MSPETGESSAARESIMEVMSMASAGRDRTVLGDFVLLFLGRRGSGCSCACGWREEVAVAAPWSSRAMIRTGSAVQDHCRLSGGLRLKARMVGPQNR